MAARSASGGTLQDNRELGEILGVSENTVRFHMKRAFRELGVRTRSPPPYVTAW